MRIAQRVAVLVLAAAGLTACSSPSTTRQLAQEAVTAMGGAEKLRSIQTLSMKDGTGTRTRLGQTVRTGDAEMPAQLTKVAEIVDLANARASLDYQLGLGPFMMHRHEILTRLGEGVAGKPVGIEIVDMRPVIATAPGGLFSWGTQNSPEFLLRRNIVTIIQAAAESAAETAATDKDFNGQMLKYGTAKSKAGEDIGLYFDPQTKLLMAFEVTETETMLGDVPAQYILADYKAVDGITLPHKITIRKGGQDYSDVQFASIVINDPSAQQTFTIPAAAAKEAEQAAAVADYTPVAITKVADGLHFVRAYSHNSMLVEFPKFLALVEAPYTEAQSMTLARLVQEQFPGKPLQYAAVTHHHYDHTGGVRGIAATGATILVAKGHEPVMRAILDAPHSNPADELSKRRAAQQPTGSIEVFEGKKVLSDGGQSLELYAITGSPHVEPMVVAFVPKPGALFQSDLFFPGFGANYSQEAQHLLESVRKLGLRVTTNVGGHGGVGPFADLVKAGTPPAAKTN